MVSEKCFPLCARKHAEGFAEALAEAQGDPTKYTVRAETLFAEASRKQLPRQSSRKGPWKQDMPEVPTNRKLVFAEAPRKVAGGRVVISKEINKE